MWFNAAPIADPFPIADWQTWATLVAVTIAGGWLVRRVWRTFRKAIRTSQGDVAGCGHCPRNPANKQDGSVVPVESIGTKRSRRP